MSTFNLNGQELQHANSEVQLQGPKGTLKLTTHMDVAYKEGAKKEPVRDYQGQIIGFVIKDQETDGSLKLRKSEWSSAVKPWLMQQYPDGRGFGQMLLKLVVTFGTTANAATAHRGTERRGRAGCGVDAGGASRFGSAGRTVAGRGAAAPAHRR